MKKTIRPFISLLIVLVFSLCLFPFAGAETAVDTILSTGTTQAFSADAVPDEDIQTILQAGISTASAINQQPWFFVAITNQDLMKEIGGSGMSFGAPPASAPEGAPSRKKRPSSPVTVPVVVPFSSTPAPMTASPLSERTRPRTVRVSFSCFFEM